jgi:hypothetical protein
MYIEAVVQANAINPACLHSDEFVLHAGPKRSAAIAWAIVGSWMAETFPRQCMKILSQSISMSIIPP